MGVPSHNVGLWALNGQGLLTLAFQKHLFLKDKAMFLILKVLPGE